MRLPELPEPDVPPPDPLPLWPLLPVLLPVPLALVPPWLEAVLPEVPDAPEVPEEPDAACEPTPELLLP